RPVGRERQAESVAAQVGREALVVLAHVVPHGRRVDGPVAQAGEERVVVEGVEEGRVPAGEAGGEAALPGPDERGRVVREDRGPGDGSRRRHAHVPPLVLARSGSTGPGGRTARLSPSARRTPGRDTPRGS